MGRFTDLRNPLMLDIRPMPDPRADTSTALPLHVCPACGSELVQPTGWRQDGDHGRWRVWRRCPECEWAGESIHGARAIDAFDERLELGSVELAESLRALELANMGEMAESFIRAIGCDLITADDFRV
jgi:hypothetical protein